MSEQSLYEKHVKIRPRPVKGRFSNLRKTAILVLLGIFHILPFFTWNGRQAIWFDMPNRRFYIFDLIIWAQDFILLTFILLGLALVLFFATSMLGRVWCGYACPHTVYTEVFLMIEQWVEGNRSEQLQLARQPWNKEKIRKYATKYFLWFLVAFTAGVGFVGYFTPIRELIPNVLTFSASGSDYFWIFFYGTFCYLQAGLVREQFCKYICPYARFQGAMFDPDTLIIAYDQKRGEPRRKLKKTDRESASDLGFCVDCTMCVQVCPTGIDIREGLQIECIACALCIDACDNMMDQIKAPRGLIRYTSTSALEGKTAKTRFIRPKTVAYAGVLSVAFTLFLISIATKSTIDLNVVPDRNVLGRKIANNRIQNIYTVKILNKSEAEREFIFELDGIENAQFDKAYSPIKVRPNEVKELIMRINAPSASLSSYSQDIDIVVIPTDNPDERMEKTTKFLKPLK